MRFETVIQELKIKKNIKKMNDDEEYQLYLLQKEQKKLKQQQEQQQQQQKQLEWQQRNERIQEIIRVSKEIKSVKNTSLKIYHYQYQPSRLSIDHCKTILMIGQTGSGKTTLINFFINFLIGVEFQDDYRFFLIQENFKKSEAQSMTENVNVYFVPPMNGYPGFKIVDTPGFGDTQGIEKDELITKKIRDCFEKQLDSIDIVCFVAQSTNARLSINQKYILNSMLNMFGNGIAKNFLCMLTFCDGSEPVILEALKFEGNQKEPKSVFSPLIKIIRPPWFLKFNCSALISNQKDQFTQMMWNVGFNSFNEFIQKLNVVQPKSLSLSRQVLKLRENLHLYIQRLRQKMQQQLNLMNEIQQIANVINTLDSQMIDTQNFKIEIDKLESRKADLKQGEYITNCSVCNFTCHYPCGIPEDSNKADCSAMKDGNCTICDKKCYWSQHVNQQFRYETYITKSYEDCKQLKNKYYNAKSTRSTKEQILVGLEKDYENAQIESMQIQESLLDSINQLKKIALQPAVCNTQIEYIDIMIREENTNKQPNFQNRIAKLQEIREQWILVIEIEQKQGNVQKTKQFYEQIVKKKEKSWISNKFSQIFK